MVGEIAEHRREQELHQRVDEDEIAAHHGRLGEVVAGQLLDQFGQYRHDDAEPDRNVEQNGHPEYRRASGGNRCQSAMRSTGSDWWRELTQPARPTQVEVRCFKGLQQALTPEVGMPIGRMASRRRRVGRALCPNCWSATSARAFRSGPDCWALPSPISARRKSSPISNGPKARRSCCRSARASGKPRPWSRRSVAAQCSRFSSARSPRSSLHSPARAGRWTRAPAKSGAAMATAKGANEKSSCSIRTGIS